MNILNDSRFRTMNAFLKTFVTWRLYKKKEKEDFVWFQNIYNNGYRWLYRKTKEEYINKSMFRMGIWLHRPNINSPALEDVLDKANISLDKKVNERKNILESFHFVRYCIGRSRIKNILQKFKIS